jgi:hypothetical protein
MKNTLITLMVSHPEINFVYEHQDEEENYILDSNEI